MEYLFLTLAFVCSVALQITISFNCKKRVVKALPLLLCLCAILYAVARFFGVIVYAGDYTGMFDDGFLTGIFLGSFSIASLIGIVFGLVIFSFVKWIRSAK